MKQAIIFLAAGKSQRMGEPKLLLPIKGKTFFEHQLSAIQSVSKDLQIIVVTNSYLIDEIRKIVGRFNQVVVVENSNENSEPYHSVEIGLSQVHKNENLNGVFVTPADVPIDEELVSTMLKQANNEVLQPHFQACGGHPIWIPMAIAKKYLDHPVRLDQFLKNFSKRFIESKSSLCVFNINTPSDWESYLEKYQ